MDAAEGPVVGVSDESGEVLGGLEVLVDDKGPSLGPFELRVDGEDDLLVALERLGGG